MQRRVLRRAAATALMLTVLATGAAFAESVAVDADSVTDGDQATRDLGSARPGQDVPVDVTFRLDCSGTSHVDAGQSVRLSPGPRTIPPGGSFRVGTVVLTPGAGWPADGAACPAGLAPITAVHHMIVTAPVDVGTDLRYVFSWTRSILPGTTTDNDVLQGVNPTVTFVLDVVDNTPPELTLPDDSTVEGDTAGGALAAYTVSASDAEDADPPTVACDPAVGALLPLGTTTVACSATDTGGLTADGSFDITVVDTTAPHLAGMPADRSLTTPDPDGLVVSYSMPSATDVVDPDPSLDCSPASGSLFPAGSTTVTCSAGDHSGNQTSKTFTVDVTYVRPVAWTATWGEPVATSGGTFIANRGRTVPIKVEIFADGVEQSAGDAWLEAGPCGAAATLRTPLTWDGARWTAHLDSGRLGAGTCFTVSASLDGHTAGSFRLDLRGDTPAAGKR